MRSALGIALVDSGFSHGFDISWLNIWPRFNNLAMENTMTKFGNGSKNLNLNHV